MAQTQALQLRFAPFELDESNARLTRDGKPVALTPKAFGVLCALARQPGQLMTKDALLDAVWGHRHVSESVLKTTISELRGALDDDPKQPRYIETASRRGYRFIGLGASAPKASSAGAASTAIPSHAATIEPAPEPPPRMVGRAKALAQLQALWEKGLSGRRQIVWIVGEAGVGKTTLIKNFLAGVDPMMWSHGQCVEQFGAGEPYLPLLEGLAVLCQRDPELPALLRANAPTWFLQLPQYCSEADRLALRQTLAGATQERMMRELRECTDAYSMTHPLLFVTEDLHWSDQSTLQLLNYLARHKGPARGMWLATFRLAEVVAEDHPLRALRHELRLQNLVTEIDLEAFSEAEVADYLADRFPGMQAPEEFVRTLHSHTEGLPLFVANVVDELDAQGALKAGANAAPDVAAIRAFEVPEDLAGVIEKQMARLPKDQRLVLEAASACGMEFRAQTVADAMQVDVSGISAQLEDLARQQQWIASGAVSRLADGSIDARYSFRHAIYRQVLLRRIGAATSAQMHRRIAASMEKSRALGVTVSPAELASHYELSHDPMAALRHYVDAVDVALKRFTPGEALTLSAHALNVAAAVPETTQRLELELRICGDRGVAASQVLGVGSPEARAAFERAGEISSKLPPAPARASELSGLGWIHFSRGEYDEAGKIGDRLQALADSRDDLVLRMTAGNLRGAVATHRGELETGRKLIEAGLAAAAKAGPKLLDAPFIVDPIVALEANLSLPLSHLGLLDRAQKQIDTAIARADLIGQPMAQMWALWWAAALALRVRDVGRVMAIGEQLQSKVSSHSIAQGEGPGLWLRGWALAQMDRAEEGCEMILRGHERHARLGMWSGQASVMSYAVEALVIAGAWKRAQELLDKARALSTKLREDIYLPDLLLLQGRIAAGQGDLAAARASMRESVKVARGQSALVPEIEALCALCELESAQAPDRKALKGSLAKLIEGRDTPIARRAAALVSSS